MEKPSSEQATDSLRHDEERERGGSFGEAAQVVDGHPRVTTTAKRSSPPERHRRSQPNRRVRPTRSPNRHSGGPGASSRSQPPATARLGGCALAAQRSRVANVPDHCVVAQPDRAAQLCGITQAIARELTRNAGSRRMRGPEDGLGTLPRRTQILGFSSGIGEMRGQGERRARDVLFCYRGTSSIGHRGSRRTRPTGSCVSSNPAEPESSSSRLLGHESDGGGVPIRTCGRRLDCG